MVLDYIQTYSANHGYAPSQKEIATHFGFKSLGTVQNYLVRLERQGLLQPRAWNARRNLSVSQPDHDDEKISPDSEGKAEESIALPLVGRVAAGYPLEAIENEDLIHVPRSMIGTGEHFVLEVQGQSMINEGILEGDYVIIRKQARANNGDTVVALIDNEATIKKFYKKKDHIELEPANPKFKTIAVSQEEAQARGFRIAGLLVGLLRLFNK